MLNLLHNSGATECANTRPPLTYWTCKEARMARSKMRPDSAVRKPLTVERLRAVLHYDPETGAFTWLQEAVRRPVGAPAGVITHGYVKISIDGVKHYGHRLAWLYMTGAWPARLVDHKNGDTSDNRFTNLRSASNSENLWNRGATRANTSGFKGVTATKRLGRMWRATIKNGGKQRHLGYFKTKEEAADAYAKAAAELHGDFARLT